MNNELMVIHKGLSVLLLGLLMSLPFACGGRAESPGPNACQAVAWGGWDGTPECAGIASIVIASEYRGCVSDGDCQLAGVTKCSAHAVNQRGASDLAGNPPPCSHPFSLFCQQNNFVPRCQQGCCVPVKM